MKHLLACCAIFFSAAMSSQAQATLGYLSLDGINDYAERENFGIGQIIPDNNDWTVELRFSMCADQGQQYLFDSRGSTAGFGIQVRFSSQTTLNVQTQSDQSGSATNNNYTVGTVLGKWHHLAVTFRNVDSLFVIYFDGQSVGSFQAGFTPRDEIVIGKADYTSAGFLDGRIDDFRVSRVIRYTSNFIPPGVFNPDLNTAVYWNFNDGQGATLFDDLAFSDWDLTGYDGAHVNNSEFTLPDPTICEGEMTQLGASGGTVFSWSPGSSLNDSTVFNPLAAPLVTTVYTVTVSDSNSCQFVGQVKVTVEPPPNVSVSVDDDSICEGASTILHASGGQTYQWTPSAGLNNPAIPNPIASPLATTTYTATGMTANGCEGTNSITITVVAAPNILATTDADTICLGASAQLGATGGVTYQWMPSTGLSDPNIANPVASPNSTTSYTVTGYDAIGCSYSTGLTIVVEDCTGLEDLNLFAFNAYPNPAIDLLRIQHSVRMEGSLVELFNALGSLVLTSTLSKSATALDIGGLPRGVYQVVISDGGIHATLTILIQ